MPASWKRKRILSEGIDFNSLRNAIVNMGFNGSFTFFFNRGSEVRGS